MQERQDYFLGIDIGTQSIKAVLCDVFGVLCAETTIPTNLVIIDGTTAYEDVEDVLKNVIDAIRETIEKARVKKEDIKALGLAAQMAGIMAIDQNFNPVGPYDSWLDTRCSQYTEKIKDKLGNEVIKLSGGQLIHSHASKILWRKHERPEEYARIAKFIQLNGYVAGKLCGLKSEEAFMDYTFLHFNCFSDNQNLIYNLKALNAFDINPAKLPKIVSPLTVIGKVKKEYAKLCGLSENTEVIAGCGDTAASSLGVGIVKPGLAYDVAGTASVFACASRKFTPDYRHGTILSSRSVIEDLYLSLAYVSGGGLCLEWFSNLTNTPLRELDQLIDEVVDEKCADLFFIPHFSGRAFPLDANLQGAFIGLSSTTEKKEMYKVILEAIAFEYKTYFDVLKSLGALKTIDAIYGVGGGVKSKVFNQIKADILEAKYCTLKNANSTPLAVALLAAKSTGYNSKSLKEIFCKKPEDLMVVLPNEKKRDYYHRKYEKYKKIVNCYSSYIKK
ncbi:MAG: xylulokinase [Bacilli bacterium]